MASWAGPPSGGRFDALPVGELIEAAVRDIEESWNHEVRVPQASQALMTQFADHFLSEIASRGALADVSLETLAAQTYGITREFLQKVRWDAHVAKAIRRSSDGVAELPHGMISRNLPEFVEKRCPCWPQ